MRLGYSRPQSLSAFYISNPPHPHLLFHLSPHFLDIYPIITYTMNATSAFSFPTFSSFPSHLPDLASSWLDSSSQCIDSIFLNADASINPSSTPGNTLSSESLFTPPPSPTDSSFFGFVPLNNSTNNSISLQPLPSHGASDLQSPTDVEQNARENMPPFQSATIASGSKRKADRDETISGPSLKKSRTLPIGQEPSQKPEEPRAGVRPLQSDIHAPSLTSFL